jgi:hypothetical protein
MLIFAVASRVSKKTPFEILEDWEDLERLH